MSVTLSVRPEALFNFGPTSESVPYAVSDTLQNEASQIYYDASKMSSRSSSN